MNQTSIFGIVKAEGEAPRFRSGDRVAISNRFPIGHYRVPLYTRGKTALVERSSSRLASITKRKDLGGTPA